MSIVPAAGNLSLVLDFGLNEEEYIETCRTRGGVLYVFRDGVLHRGPDPAEPTETWDPSARRWTPYRGGPLAWSSNWAVIPEADAERIMWPEFHPS